MCRTLKAQYCKVSGANFIRQNTMGATAILEIEMNEPKVIQIANLVPEQGGRFSNPQRGRVYSPDGLSPCIDNMGGGNREPKILGYTRDDNGNVQNYHEREIAGTLHTSSGQGGNTDQFVKETRYRIRKLTPTECLRLMGVDDSDIEKMKSAKLIQTLKPGKVKERPMPKTQLYKMAGNSIVVDVLYHIFHQMFIAEPPKPKVKQLSLFDL